MKGETMLANVIASFEAMLDREPTEWEKTLIEWTIWQTQKEIGNV